MNMISVQSKKRNVAPKTSSVSYRIVSIPSNKTSTKMIKKWKVTPVSTRPKQVVHHAPIDGRISRDDSEAPGLSATREKVPKKPRRHTTGGTKQTADDIRQAKELAAAMNEDKVVNDFDQEIDPNSTLGRKQLISMLKQRYGPEIQNFRNSGELSEKEKIRRDRQKERDLRHEQRLLENRESNHHNGVYHSPGVKNPNNARTFRPTLNSHGGSDDSEDLSQNSSPQMKRSTMSGRIGGRRTSSDDERKVDLYNPMQNGFPPAQKTAGVVFLQHRDEVKRANLPANISSLEALKALFVNAFPGKVAMPHFEDGQKTLYIKDLETGVYYQLEDISEVVNRSFLKIQELDVLSDSQSEASAYIYRTQTLPNKGHHYAESLQDYHISSPGMRRQNSYSSLRSDNVLSRPTYLSNSTTDPYSYIEDGQVKVNDQTKEKETIKSTEINHQAHQPQPMSVQDQLEDLSELLRTALNEEDKYHQHVMHEVDIKNPGKLDQNLIEDVQQKTETLVRKQKILPKHFQPTAFMLAQQEADRTTPPGQEIVKSPLKSPLKSPVKVKSSTVITISSRSKSNSLSDHNNDHGDDHSSKTGTSNKIDESYIIAAKKQTYEEKTAPSASAKNVNKGIIRHNSYNAKLSTPSPVPAANKTKEETEEYSYSTDIANSLLSQLEDLEEEVKAQSSSLDSSRSSSFRNSRRNSSTSNKSSSLQHNTTSAQANTSKPNINANAENVRTRGVSGSGTYEPYSSNSPSKSRAMTVPDGTSLQQKSRTMTVPESTPVYAQVNKNRSEFPTRSHTVTTFDAPYDTVDGDVFLDSSQKKSPQKNGTGEICRKPSLTTPDFLELESTAKNVRGAIRSLKKDLEGMRKHHIDTRRNFKADIQKKLLEFRKKAARVEEGLQQKLDINNNHIFANEHPVRERRHRLTGDQIEYNQKMETTQEKLESLEGEMEILRIDVVTKKKVDKPQELDTIHDDLTDVTKGLAELKNRYHGLHDMLKVVMTSELEIVKKEEIFLKEEPNKLEELITRCKTLSSTLFTLQKLASVQTVAPVSPSSKSQQQFFYQDKSPARNIHFNRR